MIIDTHCHYNLEPLFGDDGQDWLRHRQQAKDVGVIGAVVVGTSIETSDRAVKIAAQDPTLFAAVGYHPHLVTDAILENSESEPIRVVSWQKELEMLLEDENKQKKIVAIGEIGLDYFRVDRTSKQFSIIREKQMELCRLQIELANKFQVPIIFHVRDSEKSAYEDILSLIKQNKKTSAPFILHCVSGTVAYVKEAISLGAYIGVAGNVTYKNATNIQEIVRTVPKNRILLETDAPYLPPTPHRGKTCEPWMISLTSQYLSEVLNVNLEEVLENTYRVFPTLQLP